MKRPIKQVLAEMQSVLEEWLELPHGDDRERAYFERFSELCDERDDLIRRHWWTRFWYKFLGHGIVKFKYSK
jgi:hypothetical protein